MNKVLELWLITAVIFGFVFAIGTAIWRLRTGKRTRFGEIFSHWDFKDGFFLFVAFPFIGIFRLWRFVRRAPRSNSASVKLPRETKK